MSNLSSNVSAILIGTAIALLGGIATYYFVEYQNRIDYISYEVTKSDNLLSEISGQADLQINKRKVTNIGYVTVKLFNYTNKDLDTFDCDLMVKSNKGIKIHYIDFEDINKSKERVKGTFDPIEDTVNTKRFIHFNITPLNRSDEPVLIAKLVIEDIDDITCSIQFQKAGLEPRLIKSNGENRPVYMGLLLFLGVLTAILLPTIMILIIRKVDRKMNYVISDVLKAYAERKTDNPT